MAAVLAVLAAVCLIAGLCLVKTTAYSYTDAVNITSAAGDAFVGQGTTYDGQTSFVYSAEVSFNGGDAAALTFGGTDEGCWAFNIDRTSNLVKLLYFTVTETGYEAAELKTEYFIGNDKTTAAELAIIGPNVKQIESFSLKIVVTASDGSAYLECYADGIRRFAYVDGSAEAESIDLTTDFGDLVYTGGSLGFNVCNADVVFSDIAAGGHDYAYYSELYRNQFHYSPFAHWNNDPNGLVYYNGYYHMYYQHCPYGSEWGDMYWGHARSTDLIHWENLPICLFPEKAGYDGCFGTADGYMWSGSVRVYHKGESAVIDGANWFSGISSLSDGESAGLIGFYTRDGERQDQMIMSSDDGGLTWIKRALIASQSILGLGSGKTDCRDPKVFSFDNGGTTVFGMLLTGMSAGKVWFLSSYDLVNWSAAGGFCAAVPLVNSDATNGPECPDIAFLTADDGVEKTVITLAGRGYAVGDLTYKNGKFVFSVDGTDVSETDTLTLKQMDFGPDSYATQTFYIDGGEYAGKIVSISWFSGVPGAEASVDSGLLSVLRDGWNGGMTIPVVWGLTCVDGGYVLTQTPVTKNSSLNKKTIVSVKNYGVTAGTDVLKSVAATVFEIDATISNPSGGAVAFRIRVGQNEYTEIGWNSVDGYYVDRTHTASGNMTLAGYGGRYACATADSAQLTFYILCDNGGLEVFCGNGAAPFYVLAFFSPNSSGMSFVSECDVTFISLSVSKISSVWRQSDTSVLKIGSDAVVLDLTLTPEKEVLVYGSESVSYEITEGRDIISYTVTTDGIKISAESAGSATIKVACGSLIEYIAVTVYGGQADADCAFTVIKSGEWYSSSDGYIGSIASGDAFILSQTEGSNFLYSAQFDLKSGIAAALVFRASADMTQYVIANYDDNAGLVKLWSSAGDSVEVGKKLTDLTDVVLLVSVSGRSVKVYLNAELVIDCTLCDGAPESGLFGLNVCAAEVVFKAVSITEADGGEYVSGDVVWNHTDTSSFTVVNLGWNNAAVDAGFYTVEGRRVVLSQNYMACLPAAGVYVLEVRGQNSLYTLELNVAAVPSAVWQDLTLQQNTNAVFFIGNASGAVKVNGAVLDEALYEISGMQLTVYASAFAIGDNEVVFADSLSAVVTVNAAEYLTAGYNEGNSGLIYTVLFIIVGAVIAAEVVMIGIILCKREEKNGCND